MSEAHGDGRSVFAGRLLLGVIKIFPADGAHRHKRDLPEGEFPAPRYGPLCSRGQARRNGALIRHFLNRNVR
jgi:hypothetical protein